MNDQRNAVLEAVGAPEGHWRTLFGDTPVARMLLLGGTALFALVIWKTGVASIAAQLDAMSWRLPLVVLPYALGAAFDTLGWWYSFPHPGCPLRYNELFQLRLAAKAIQETTPALAQIGEVVKIYLLRVTRAAWPMAVASVIAAKTSISVAQLMFIFAGLLLVPRLVPEARELLPEAWSGLLVVGLLLIGVLVWQRFGFFQPLIRLGRSARLLTPILSRYEGRLRAADDMLAKFLREQSRDFWRSCAWHFLGWVAGALEGWIILVLLNVPVDLLTAFVIEVLVLIVQGTTGFIPANLGVLEAGTMAIFAWLGYPAETAITFALLRRLRQIVWVAVGLSFLRRLLRVDRCAVLS